jgi:hypothetical protein
MGESLKGRKVRKCETNPQATPNQDPKGRLGYDQCAVSVSSLRVGGDARSLNEAPSCLTHRPIRAGLTSRAPAGSDLNVAGFVLNHFLTTKKT